MKHSFEKIPTQLQNAVIAFTGVGKSYVKQAWAEKLSNLGYQVILTGSTNKACQINNGKKYKTIYSVADWTDIKKTRSTKSFSRKEGRIFPQTSAVICIDEALMLCQEDIEQIKRQFPKSCILIFGDPNQFPPIEDKKVLDAFDEMPKDQYEAAIAEIRKAVKKGIQKRSIYSVDYTFNLTKQYRVKTPELKRFLDNCKYGWKDQEDAIRFMQKHKENNYFDFAICRTWWGTNGVHSYENWVTENGNYVCKGLKDGITGVYVGQNNIGAIKNAIYNPNGHSYESDLFESDNTTFKDERNYKLQGALTCHSIQGTTLNEGTKVLVDFDDAMSICPEEYNESYKEVYLDFQRFVYVACSRVHSEEDLYIKCRNMKKFLKIMSYGVELKESLKANEITSSGELCCYDNPIELLLSKEELKDRKPQEFKAIGRKQFDIENLAKLAYYKSYNSLTEPNFDSQKDVCNLLEISTDTYQRHKVEIKYMLTHLEEYIDMNKTTAKVATTGKTIGEIEEEMVKDEEIEGNLDVLVEKEIEKCFYEKDKTMFRELWSKAPSSDRREKFEFIKEMIEKHYTK